MACAEGLFALLGLAVPGRAKELASNSKDDFPIVCKWASLLEPNGMAALPCKPAARGISLQSVQQGDLVILSKPLKPEVHLCPAVVIEVKSARCTVAVLDATRSFQIAECQAHVSDLQPVHSEWRLGEQLVITGLGGGKMKHLDGLSATVCEHRRHGHPCFIQKAGDSNAKLKLKICVQWHDPQVDETGAVLLEPGQLVPCGAQVLSDQPPSNNSWTRNENKSISSRKNPDHQYFHDTTLLTASQRPCSLNHHDTYKDLPSGPKSPMPAPPKSVPSYAAGGMMDLISWMVEKRAPRLCDAEDEWPTVCKMTSVIAVDEKSPRRDFTMLGAIPESQDEGMQTQQRQHHAKTHSTPTQAKKPAEGDLVILGRCVQPEFQLCWAVVTTVEDHFCKVAVLDNTKSFCIGECCLESSHMLPVSSDWRVGSRLVIGGLQSSRMRHLNGLTGIVHPHRRHGHPCFVPRTSDSDDDKLWLNICIRLEDPEKASMHAVLLEPSLLFPCAQVSNSRTLAMPEKPLRKQSSNKSVGYEKSLSLASTASGTGTYSRTSSLPSSASFSSSGSSTEMSSEQRLRELDELRERLKAMV